MFLVAVLWQYVRLLNCAGAAYLMLWAVFIIRRRRTTHDVLGGEWLALSWIAFNLATLIGSAYAYHKGLLTTPGLFITSVAIILGMVAQWVGLRRIQEVHNGQ